MITPDSKIQTLMAECREPAIWFQTVDKADSKSRSGGLPSLPEGLDWPVSRETGVPLHFMAQVDLSALPETPLPGCPFQAVLPREGMLFFFYPFAEYFPEWEAEGTPSAGLNSRVIYTRAAGTDQPAPEVLPFIGHEPGQMGGSSARDTKIVLHRHCEPTR